MFLSMRHLIGLFWFGAAAGAAWAQTGEILKASFRDASRPGTIRANILRGSITVKGYSGNEVIVQSVTRPVEEEEEEEDKDKDKDKDKSGKRRDGAPDTAGLRRILLPSPGLSIEEENNVMKISVHSTRRSKDILLQVPLRTSLKLETINRGKITVENVEGDIEVSNIHGAIHLSNVSGSVVAHALHGGITAALRSVNPAKPLSFSALHGTVDVTLPASLKATLNIRSGRGDVFSDFDVVVGSSPAKVEESGAKDTKSGRYRVSTGDSVTAQINGGGQEISFKNLHGNIYIRKGK